eukprot:202765_1
MPKRKQKKVGQKLLTSHELNQTLHINVPRVNVSPIIPENESIRETLVAEDMIGSDQYPNDIQLEEDVKEAESSMIVPEPQLITTITQKEQSRFNCVDYKTNDQSNYNLMFGDLQKWRIHTLSDNNKNVNSEDLWFLKDQKSRKQRRKIFVEGKVHRVWNINADEETFEAKLHLFLSWIVTKDEYLLCIEEEKKCELFDDCTESVETAIDNKIWHPIIHIPNLVHGTQQFADTGNNIKFKIVSYKKFAGFGEDRSIDIEKLNQNTIDIRDVEQVEKESFDIRHAKFIRCKIEIKGLFYGDFELKNFPFDLQNLCVTIMERSGRATFLPAFRERKQFMNVDSFCFEVKEWDLEATMFEFVDSNPNYDQQSFGKNLSQFIIGFKYKKK